MKIFFKIKYSALKMTLVATLAVLFIPLLDEGPCKLSKKKIIALKTSSKPKKT